MTVHVRAQRERGDCYLSLCQRENKISRRVEKEHVKRQKKNSVAGFKSYPSTDINDLSKTHAGHPDPQGTHWHQAEMCLYCTSASLAAELII